MHCDKIMLGVATSCSAVLGAWQAIQASKASAWQPLSSCLLLSTCQKAVFAVAVQKLALLVMFSHRSPAIKVVLSLPCRHQSHPAHRSISW